MKSLKTLGAVALLSTSMLGAATSFAASSTDTVENNNAKTPVQTKFKVADDGGKNEQPENPTDPSHPDQNPDGNKPLDPKGPFGIAYVPNRLFTQNFESGETLNESGAQEFNFKNEDAHVGVKDKTHTKGGWTLKAKLAWDSGSELAGSTILATTGGAVKVNKGGAEGTPSYDSTSDVTTQDQLTISDQESEIMNARNLDNTVYNNTFDVKLGTPKLRVPDAGQVEAKEYTGNVVWTLTASPLY